MNRQNWYELEQERRRTLRNNELPTNIKRWTTGQIIGWGITLIIATAVLTVIGSYVFLGVNWLTVPTKLYDADHVQEVYTSYIERSNELGSLRDQVRGVERAIKDIQDKNAGYAGMQQWSVQDRADYDNYSKTRLGLVTAYNRQCAQYNSDWDNWYKQTSVAVTDLKLKVPEGCKTISD